MSGSGAFEAPVGESPVWIKPMYVLNHTEPEVWISMMLQPKDKLILTQGRSLSFQATSALTRLPTLFANVTLHLSLSWTLLSHCG